MYSSTRIPITERTLIQRLNRKLKEHDLVLKKRRSGFLAHSNAGSYFIVDSELNAVVQRNLDTIDLQGLARSQKVLAEWEVLVLERNSYV